MKPAKQARPLWKGMGSKGYLFYWKEKGIHKGRKVWYVWVEESDGSIHSLGVANDRPPKGGSICNDAETASFLLMGGTS